MTTIETDILKSSIRVEITCTDRAMMICCQRLADLENEHCNRQDYTLAWLDVNVDKRDEHTRKLVRKLSDHITVFSDIIECHQYLSNKRDSVFLIISGACATQCLSRIHNLPTIDSIFIYCALPSKYKQLINTNKKVVSCVSTEKELLNEVHWWTELKCSTQLYTCGNDLHRLTRDSSLFLAYLLALDAIPLGGTKEDMIRVCRKYYAGNTVENTNIDEFEATYTKDQAVLWYTKNAFIYKMLKKVLRLFDLDKLYAFGFYIRDLKEQLQKWHYVPSKSFSVYRGLTMSSINIAQLQANVGNLFAPNGFLSTSRTREIAMKYARKEGTLGEDDNFGNVLLEIEINTDVFSSCIFADVGRASAFPDEREILFSTGAVFRVDEVSFSSETNAYIVKVKVANAKEYDLIKNLLVVARDKFGEYTDQQLILKLLHYAQTFAHCHINFDRLWTWDDLKNGMYATSQRAMKALVSGAYKFTRTNTLYVNSESTGRKDLYMFVKVVVNCIEVNKAKPGFCFYSGALGLQMQLKTDVDDDKNWISSGKLNRILASADFQEFPRTYFVFSDITLASHLQILGSKWLHIYCVGDEADLDQVRTEFCHDLAQYYRQTAQKILRERNDRSTAKCFLVKSTRLYEQLEKATEERIKRFAKLSSC